MDDFNITISDKAMEDFCSLNNVESLSKKTTCYKTHENPTCTDLIVTKDAAISSTVMYFRLVFLVFIYLLPHNLKKVFKKKLRKIIAYRDYKKTDNAKFHDDVNSFAFDQFYVSNFKEIILDIFDKLTPIKQIYLRANEVFLITKELHKKL